MYEVCVVIASSLLERFVGNADDLADLVREGYIFCRQCAACVHVPHIVTYYAMGLHVAWGANFGVP